MRRTQDCNAGPVTAYPLAGWILLEGESAVAAHPDGECTLFCSEAEGILFEAELPEFGPGVYSSFTSHDLFGLTDLSFNDRGHLFVTRWNDVVEFEELAPGTWSPVAGSPFSGMGLGGGRFLITCSRTNFDPKIHSGPGWQHLPLDEAGIEGPFVPDCPADIVPNSVVNVDDLVEVILHWGSLPRHLSRGQAQHIVALGRTIDGALQLPRRVAGPPRPPLARQVTRRRPGIASARSFGSGHREAARHPRGASWRSPARTREQAVFRFLDKAPWRWCSPWTRQGGTALTVRRGVNRTGCLGLF